MDDLSKLIKANELRSLDPETQRFELVTAAGEGRIDAVHAFIVAGVYPHLPDRHGRLPLLEAIAAGHDEVASLLVAEEVRDDELRRSVFLLAAERGLLGVVRTLIQQGADLDAADENGQTALGQAAARGHTEVVRLLLQAGADANLGVEASPLVAALAGGHDEIVAMLGAAGGDKRFGGLALEDLRGVNSFDVDEFWLLIQTDVERAAEAFVHVRQAEDWQRDVFDREVQLTDNCFLVSRLRGHVWTLICSLRSTDHRQWLSNDDAKKMSARIGVKAIFYGNSDTACAVGYALYDSGELAELFDDNCDFDDELSSDGDGEEATSEAAGQRDGGPRFHSTLRTVLPEQRFIPYDFVDAFFRWQRAFVPAFGLSLIGTILFKTGERVRISIGGLEANDVERCDFVSLCSLPDSNGLSSADKWPF